ncbi:hypothetical protein MMC26_000324 [Xylographa opegraphella]|nr:hypothetical protein [Xylographa opegraphella]
MLTPSAQRAPYEPWYDFFLSHGSNACLWHPVTLAGLFITKAQKGHRIETTGRMLLFLWVGMGRPKPNMDNMMAHHSKVPDCGWDRISARACLHKDDGHMIAGVPHEAKYVLAGGEHGDEFGHNRRVYFEVALNLGFGEGSSSTPVYFPVKTAIWIEGSQGEDPLKIDLRLVRYPSGPAATLFTPYVQELFFEFPRLPPSNYKIGDWVSVEAGVEIFVCAETHATNMEIMKIADGQGILLNRIKRDTLLSTARIDPNIFMYDLLLDLMGSSKWRYERLLHHIIESRSFFRQKNDAWVSFMPVAVYQAGDSGKYRRFFDLRDPEKPIGLTSTQSLPFIRSIAHEVISEAQNPYVDSWGTVGMDSSARPTDWTPRELDVLNLGYF